LLYFCIALPIFVKVSDFYPVYCTVRAKLTLLYAYEKRQQGCLSSFARLQARSAFYMIYTLFRLAQKSEEKNLSE
jgi:hypothetical protein